MYRAPFKVTGVVSPESDYHVGSGKSSLSSRESGIDAAEGRARSRSFHHLGVTIKERLSRATTSVSLHALAGFPSMQTNETSPPESRLSFVFPKARKLSECQETCIPTRIVISKRKPQRRDKCLMPSQGKAKQTKCDLPSRQ